jgi:hypothetical protein
MANGDYTDDRYQRYQTIEYKRAIHFLSVANSIGLLAMVAWLIGLSYIAGVRSNIMDNNTRRIDYIENNGVYGTKSRLDELERRENQQDLTIEMLREEFDGTRTGRRR